MTISYSVSSAFLPVDLYRRHDRYWPYPRQFPSLLQPRGRKA